MWEVEDGGGWGVGKGPAALHPLLSQLLPFQILALRVLIHWPVWEVEATLQRGQVELRRGHTRTQRTWGWIWGAFPHSQLLLQSLGLSSSHDRALVKRKVKELAAAAEKERKAQEKAARQREKLRRREQEAKKS